MAGNFRPLGYAEFKRNLAELIIDLLSPIQARYKSMAADPEMLAEVLRRGAHSTGRRSEANSCTGGVSCRRVHSRRAGPTPPRRAEVEQ